MVSEHPVPTPPETFATTAADLSKGGTSTARVEPPTTVTKGSQVLETFEEPVPVPDLSLQSAGNTLPEVGSQVVETAAPTEEATLVFGADARPKAPPTSVTEAPHLVTTAVTSKGSVSAPDVGSENAADVGREASPAFDTEEPTTEAAPAPGFNWQSASGARPDAQPTFVTEGS